MVYGLKGRDRASHPRQEALFKAALFQAASGGRDQPLIGNPGDQIEAQHLTIVADSFVTMTGRTIDLRIDEARRIITDYQADGQLDQIVLWCDLNDEGDELTRQIHGAVQIAGRDDAGRLRALGEVDAELLQRLALAHADTFAEHP